MDADTIVSVGNFCETLLLNPTFQFLSGWFEQSSVAELLATQPHETKSRESIYNKITAHREFLSLLKEMVDKKNAALAPHQTDPLDDPSVHEIYKDIVN